LREFSGRDREIIEFLKAAPQVEEMIADIARFLERWVARFEASDRTYLTIGVGCTGGRHRSVYVAERLAERIAAQDQPVLLTHRDL
ncbi:MAG: RapZ C-terminal domain-containing protein, partial [Gammaproteobacteria bacterium]